ncbi:MAG: OmpA family protein [Methylovulum sp.]|nr:OmpA family protein [Methylovulum sp.]
MKELFSRRFNKCSVLILLGLIVSGCSATTAIFCSFQKNNGAVNAVSVTAYLPPVVATLDYNIINDSKEQVIVRGGFQHALSIYGQERITPGLITVNRWLNPAVMKKERVYFEYDRSALRVSEAEKLNSFIDPIEPMGLMHIEVNGYTDFSGSAKYNKELSLKRAETVRDYLVKQGVSPSNISVNGFGEAFPAESNDTALHRAKNRRAEISSITGH